MKAALIAALCLMTVAATATAEPAAEIVLNGRSIVPAKSEDWTSAGGIEAQLRFWNETGFGLGLSVGADRWNAADDFYEEADAYGYYSMAIHGELTAIPVGVSLLQRLWIAEHLALVLDAGLRYVICDSGMTVDTEIQDAQGHDWYCDPIEVDNALLGAFGISLEGELTEEIALRGGFGYQVDLVKPEERHLGRDIGASSLQGAVFSFGLVIRF